MDIIRYGGDQAVHAEMQARTRDIYRIYNPLEVEFKFKYDGLWNTVNARSAKDVEMYLAVHFFEKIADFIIGQMATDRGKKFIEDRREKGMVEFMNKYEENIAIWDNMPRTNDKTLREAVAQQCILGLVEKYGVDEPPEAEKEVIKPSLKSVSEQIFSTFASKVAEEPKLDKPLAKSRPVKDLAAEVTLKDLAEESK